MVGVPRLGSNLSHLILQGCNRDPELPDTLYAVDPSIVGDPESEFHTWRISYDVAAQTLTISKDGVQVLSQSEVQNGGHGEQTGLRLATSNEGILGVSDVYLDYIAFKQ